MVYSPGDDESRDRRAEVGSRVVPELGDERVSLERRLNEAALNTAAPPVHEAHLAQPGLGSGVYVVCDDASDIPWDEGVQVDFGFDGDADGCIRHDFVRQP
jgi:hypothetical protein